MEKMFSYTPVQSQVQINSMPMINTKSKAAEAFDSISSIVSSVGNAYVNGKEIDYQQSVRDKAAAKEQAKIEADLKKEKDNQLYQDYQTSISQQVATINNYLVAGKTQEAFTEFQNLQGWAGQLPVNDNTLLTSQLDEKILTATNGYRETFTTIAQKDAGIKYSSSLNTSVSLGMSKIDYELLGQQASAAGKLDKHEDTVTSTLYNTTVSQIQATSKDSDLVTKFKTVTEAKNALLNKFKEFGIKEDNTNYIKYNGELNNLQQKIADTMLEQSRSIAQGVDRKALVTSLNEVAATGYVEKEEIEAVLENFDKKKKENTEKINVNNNAINNPFTADLSDPLLSKKTKVIIKEAYRTAILNNDWTSLTTAMENNVAQVKSVTSEFFATELATLGGSANNQEAVSKINKLYSIATSGADTNTVSKDVVGDLLLAKGIIETTGVKDFWTNYSTAKKNELAGVESISEQRLKYVRNNLPNDIEGQAAVLRKINAMSLQGLNVTTATVDSLIEPYKPIVIDKNSYSKNVASALNLSGKYKDDYLDVFLNQLVNNKRMTAADKQEFLKGGFSIRETTSGFIQITTKSGVTANIDRSFVFGKDFKEARAKAVTKRVTEKSNTGAQKIMNRVSDSLYNYKTNFMNLINK